jgi:hypothetical protein
VGEFSTRLWPFTGGDVAQLTAGLAASNDLRGLGK